MRIKLFLATLIGAVTINGVVAGPCNYCPPPAECDKCPIDCRDDLPGHVGVSYMSDYIFRGVRYSRDAVAFNASYTFEKCCLPITLGFQHVSSLNSQANLNNPTAAIPFGGTTRMGRPGGDQTNIFAEIGLPSICGFELSARYDHWFYPNLRLPQNDPRANVLAPFAGLGNYGDSHGAVGIKISRELFCCLNLAVTSQYDFNTPGAGLPINGTATNADPDNGAWIHTAELSRSFCITDCIGLDLKGGVLYTDNVWSHAANVSVPPLGNPGDSGASGWNSYYIEAGLPIIVGRCAVLTPYIGYNGTPDTWQADGVYNNVAGGSLNNNDVFHGGVRLGVDF
ncbi:MAG: hypothetical protein P1V20_31650 [Verrucomicrobiales bacterium]|nr:hypothetical protein [Verrucomicrobiales bacterium]